MSAESTREQLYAEKAVVILREKDANLVRKRPTPRATAVSGSRRSPGPPPRSRS